MIRRLFDLFPFISSNLRHLNCVDVVWLIFFLGLHFCLSMAQSNSVTLPIYEQDSFVFLQKLVLMFEGVLDRNVVQHFSYGFYNYGYVYFLGCLLLTWPWMILKQYAVVIVICRFVSSLFLVGSFVVLNKWFQKFCSSYHASLLMISVGVSVPFWSPSFLFYPDFIMAFFVCLSILMMGGPKQCSMRRFWWGAFYFAIAIALKIQALLYVPLFVFVAFPVLWRNQSVLSDRQSTIRFFVGWGVYGVLIAGLWGLVFICMNPFVLHPKGMLAFLHRFQENTVGGSKDLIVIVYCSVYFGLGMFMLIWRWMQGHVYRQKWGVCVGMCLMMGVVIGCHWFGLQSKYYIVFYMMCFGVFAMGLSYWRSRHQSIALYLLLFVMIGLNVGPVSSQLMGRFREDPMKASLQFVLSEHLQDLQPSDYILVSCGLPIDFVAHHFPISHIEVIYSGLLAYRFDRHAFYQKWKKFDLENNPHIKSFHPKKYIILSKKIHQNEVDFQLPYLNLSYDGKAYPRYVRSFENTDIVIYTYSRES